MKYGEFSDDGREFLIHNVATPTPWINYLYNGRYFSTISNNSGGISYFGNPLHGRVTRYRINDVPPDRPGKYVYVRDRDSGEYWSLSWQPVGRDRPRYKVAHGFGYTRIETNVSRIVSKMTCLVPLDDDRELWDVMLTNQSDRPRRLSLTGYVEFCLGHAHVDLINQCDDQHFNRVHFEEDLNTLFATKTYWVTRHSGTQQQENQAWNQWAYFTASEPVVRYETMRERFIGPYRNENNPIAVEMGEMASRGTDYGNVVGALQLELDLKPGESRRVIFSLGVIAKRSFDKDKAATLAKYRNGKAVDDALAAVRKHWDEYFNHMRVNTPEDHLNVFINYWIPYQARVAFDVGRVASFYYWGISRGFGFRDTAQDTIAITQSDPERARRRIHLLARQMFRDGRVFHHFTSDGQGETTRHCDDPFWLILAVTDYIKETGDTGILEKQEPFLDDNTATMLEHLLAILKRAGAENLGKHGLPIFGRGDWNDTLDYIGGADGGESVWGGMFFVAMMNQFIELLEFLGRNDLITQVKAVRDPLVENLNTHCWDGEWFIRAFGAKDRKIGSKESDAGRIFLNAQSWAVLANLAGRARLTQCMDSVRKHLDSDVGPKICAPAYRKIDPEIGLITRCVGGKKENGAVFCHPVTWCIMAECLLGRGDEAYRYFTKTLPDRIDSDTFMAEPYVYSQYITSDEHDEPGRASHSWQTGTAAWMKKVVIDYLLGVRAMYEGLKIDPAIPSHWKTYTVERVYRGVRYVIEVHNPAGVQNGVKKVDVEGKTIEGNVVPIQPGPVCHVAVEMG